MTRVLKFVLSLGLSVVPGWSRAHAAAVGALLVLGLGFVGREGIGVVEYAAAVPEEYRFVELAPEVEPPRLEVAGMPERVTAEFPLGMVVGAALGWLVGVAAVALVERPRARRRAARAAKVAAEGRADVPPAPPSLSRWPLRLASLFVALLTLAGASRLAPLEWDHCAGRLALSAAVAQTDALDPRWRWDDLVEDRPPAVEGEGALAVAMRVRAGWTEDERFKLKIVQYPMMLAQETWLCGVAATLWRESECVRLARGLARAPIGRHEVALAPVWLDTRLPHIDSAKEAAAILIHLAELDSDAGRGEDALDAVTGILNLSDSLSATRSGPFDTGVGLYLRVAACRVLERCLNLGEPSVERLAALADRLWTAAQSDPMLASLRASRAIGMTGFDALENGQVTLERMIRSARGNYAASSLFPHHELLGRLHLWRTHRADAAFWLTLHNRLIASRPLGHDARLAVAAVVDDDAQSETQRPPEVRRRLTLGFCPRLTITAESEKYGDVGRAAILVIGVERYRQVRGAFPQDKSDLFPEFMPQTATPDDFGAMIFETDGPAIGFGPHVQHAVPDAPSVGLFPPDLRRTPFFPEEPPDDPDDPFHDP